jgi:hypothetical protein
MYFASSCLLYCSSYCVVSLVIIRKYSKYSNYFNTRKAMDKLFQWLYDLFKIVSRIIIHRISGFLDSRYSRERDVSETGFVSVLG